jgi:hypothetical protein
MARSQDNDFVTRTELHEELELFGKNLSRTIARTVTDDVTERVTASVTKSVTAKVTEIVAENFRQELDSKLGAQEKRLITRMEDLLADQSLELTNAMSDMVAPFYKIIQNHT